MMRSTDSVLNSRAGDRFHYLWAARRCLQMINPSSRVKAITIEGSPEPNAAGELVIDVGEVYSEEDSLDSVRYYQLKHSTVRTSKAFTLSELAKTLKGFAERFREMRTNGSSKFGHCDFYFVSNRQVGAEIKRVVQALTQGQKVPAASGKKFKNVTGLSIGDLEDFCGCLHFMDQEGDYVEQARELQYEQSRYSAGAIEDSSTLRLVGLVADQALPTPTGARARGTILREHVLKVFGVAHASDLFPAPRAMESIAHTFQREQHKELVGEIVRAVDHIIIHATGGVGKSVVAQQLALSFPRGSAAVVFDCFGGGNYLNQSRPRHRACDALVQIVNELSTNGLCNMLISSPSQPVSEVVKGFLRHLEEASNAVSNRNPEALIVLLIDAADNAEMAATAFGDTCFASSIIREKIPSNCRLVYLCRTERLKLLKPLSRTKQLLLKGFSVTESLQHLRMSFPRASNAEAKEFHRLTGANPRVQATCLFFAKGSVREMLGTLSPGRTTIDQQIGQQLQLAIARLRDDNPLVLHDQIDAICRGLATLPPFIPIPVLAAAAGVEADTVKSFIADLGRPLWCSDDSVQFRDEPTEYWFKQTFAAARSDIQKYTAALEPFAATFAYAARSLPALWHQANEHDKLISRALSDEFLPNNPVDAREIRVFRLQYALKAALKIARTVDAAKLAFRAGEEMAGNQRQLDLMLRNIDLMTNLHEPHFIQEVAYKRQLKAGWRGSENVYAASLLSFHKDFHGEATNYLFAAENWLQLHFAERAKAKNKDMPQHQDSLSHECIAELGWAHLGLYGPAGYCKFIAGWKPPQLLYEVTRIVTRRLVDAGRFEAIEEIAKSGRKHTHLVIALTDELALVAKFPPEIALSWSLDRLADGRAVFAKSSHSSYFDTETQALVSFAEACAYHHLPPEKICSILEGKPIEIPTVYSLVSDSDEMSRHTFARAIALQAVLRNKDAPVVLSILPDKKNSREDHQELGNARRVLETLMRLYEIRAKIIARVQGWNDLPSFDVKSLANQGPSDYGSRFRLEGFWAELPLLRLKIIALRKFPRIDELDFVRQSFKTSNNAWCSLTKRTQMTRLAYRHPQLHGFGRETESATRRMMLAARSPEPDARIEWGILLARAVLPINAADAAGYFEEAFEAASKFEEELIDQWQAINILARASEEPKQKNPELAYRYVRCAELVGISVAREKHWDRPDVFRVLMKLDPASVFTSASRWRERGIGYFPHQIHATCEACLSSGNLSSTASYCLSGFIGVHAAQDILALALEHEVNPRNRQAIFDQGMQDSFRAGELFQKSTECFSLAEKHHLNTTLLADLIEQARRSEATTATTPELTPGLEITKVSRISRQQSAIFQGIDVATAVGIDRVVSAFNQTSFPREPDAFWTTLFELIRPGEEANFLQAAIDAHELDFWGMKKILAKAKINWLTKVSVQRRWSAILKATGKKFHASLSQRGAMSYWQESILFDEAELTEILLGIREGIESRSALLDSSSLFGFVGVLAKRLQAGEARDVLAFALQRFEQHLPDDFGDGLWSGWLAPPASVLDAFTGMLWVALGTPDSATRWEAAHCVRRLVELGCETELCSLLSWLHRPDVSPFLAKEYNFYQLHAIRFFLLGFARGSLDNAKTLANHINTIAALALDSTPHALIQPEAAELALAIEKSAPGLLPKETISRLRQVGMTQFPYRKAEANCSIRSPWHVDQNRLWPTLPHFGMDMTQYWISGFVGVFGLPQSEIVDLMREVATTMLGASATESYPEDARRELRGSRHSDWRNTYYRQSSYPHIEDWNFYFSYQSLMIVGAKLLLNLPVLARNETWANETGDRWQSWRRRHQISRLDGRWLADRRDPTPPPRKAASANVNRAEWIWGVRADDFFEVLTAQTPLMQSICISGSWSDTLYDQDERIATTSALVRTEMADSLARAIRTANHPNWSSLAAIFDDPDQKGKCPFDLQPLISFRGDYDNGIDDFDPHSNALKYPPRELVSSIVQSFELESDIEKRQWNLPGQNTPSVIVEMWRDRREEISRGRFIRQGERVFASVPFLQQICRKFEKTLIISVDIQRSTDESIRFSDDSSSFIYPSRKVFILDQNGSLRDTRAHYELG